MDGDAELVRAGQAQGGIWNRGDDDDGSALGDGPAVISQAVEVVVGTQGVRGGAFAQCIVVAAVVEGSPPGGDAVLGALHQMEIIQCAGQGGDHGDIGGRHGEIISADGVVRTVVVAVGDMPSFGRVGVTQRDGGGRRIIGGVADLDAVAGSGDMFAQGKGVEAAGTGLVAGRSAAVTHSDIG